MSKRPHIPRRAFLRGAGVTMALPLLDAMLPMPLALANPSPDEPGRKVGEYPVRFAVLFMPNGVNPHTWTPEGRGRDFKLSPILAPLDRHREQITVLTNLDHDRVRWGDGHYVKTAAWLTGTAITKTTGADVASNGVSVDQLAARHIGHLTRLPSMELSLEPTRTAVDVNVGFTQLYGGHISWSTPTTPVARELNPRLAFDRLFRSAAGNANQLSADDRSVLDLVRDDARSLRGSLGAEDRRKLDEYLESVRSVEKRIDFEAKRRTVEQADDPTMRDAMAKLDARIGAWSAQSKPGEERIVDHTEHARLMLDLIALAFWTDSTRIATLMFGRDVSPRSFRFLDGVHDSHHELSHHENNPDKLAQYQRINVWHVEHVAYLLDKLAAVKEGDRTLLDNSSILFGSSLRDGNAHSPSNLPLVLAGRAGNQIAPGRHVVYKDSTPLANLYLANLRHLGVNTTQFSDSTGPLPGLDDPAFAAA